MLWHVHARNALCDPELETVETLLRSEKGEFAPSKTYDGNESVISPNRRSKERALSNPALFEIGQRALHRICPDVVPLLRLVRGHIDHVESSVGDFFHAHTDFSLMATPTGTLSLTLLICIEAPEIGGELCLYANDEIRQVSIRYERGSATLFPCTVPHAALEISKGAKVLLKFDLVSEEVLWKCELGGSGVEKIVRHSIIRRLDALAAKVVFDKDVGCIKTELVNEEELRLASRFFDGLELTEVDIGNVHEILHRLCCAEACLSEEDLGTLHERAYIVLAARPLAALYTQHMNYKLVFLACAHRIRYESRGVLNFGELVGYSEPEKELLQCHCCVDISTNTAAFVCANGASSVFAIDSDDHAEKRVKGRVLDFALDMIEAYDETLITRTFDMSPYDEDADSSHSIAEEEVPPSGARAVAGDALFGIAKEMEGHCARALSAIEREQPIQKIVSAFSEHEECNDGSTYREVNYETTLMRWGYVLLRIRDAI